MNKRTKSSGNSHVLSAGERSIYGYIYNRFNQLERSTNGKAVYARNVDQVMKDLFGIKKFCKTLERARYSEIKMKSLIKGLGESTLWALTRSEENFSIMCQLVALDSQIVQNMKKLDKYKALDASERPTNKMRKLAKLLKKQQKMYKSVIRTLRDVHDIKRVSDVSGDNAVMDRLGDWLDRQGDDDIFFDISYDEGADFESMDEYVRRKTGGRRNGNTDFGAMDSDIFDDDDYEDDDDDEDDDEKARMADLIGVLARRSGVGMNDINAYLNGSRNTIGRSGRQYNQIGSADAADIVSAIRDGFADIRNDMRNSMHDIGNDFAEEEVYTSDDGEMSIEQMMDMSDAAPTTPAPTTFVSSDIPTTEESTQ